MPSSAAGPPRPSIPAGRIDQLGPFRRVVREDFQEMAAGILRIDHDPIGAGGGAEDSVQAAHAVGFGAPGGVHQKTQVVQGVDQARPPEAARAEEVIAVDDVRAADAGFEIGLRLAPEALRFLEAVRRFQRRKAGLSVAIGRRGPVQGPRTGRRRPGRVYTSFSAPESLQRPYKALGVVSASGLAGAGLADVESDPHGRGVSPSAPPTHRPPSRSIRGEIRWFQRRAAHHASAETPAEKRRLRRGTPRSSSTAWA